MSRRQGLKKSIFCKEEYLGGGGFLLPLLAQGPWLPVLISPSIRFPYLMSPSRKPEHGVQPKHMRFDTLLYLNSHSAASQNTCAGPMA